MNRSPISRRHGFAASLNSAGMLSSHATPSDVPPHVRERASGTSTIDGYRRPEGGPAFEQETHLAHE
ncbi:MAG: hypothetical protein M3P18_19530, partial [Actinomycetota bacterium]|nr:hypothetical protein [Actinomycetota bacterium]